MNNIRRGPAIAALWFQTVLLLVVGTVMWNGEGTDADVAVGKGLVTLSAAIGVPAFFWLASLLESPSQAEGPVGSDD